nr:hypothetical protein [uncultured Draconibacterium sp.]
MKLNSDIDFRIPDLSVLKRDDYSRFIGESYELLKKHSLYFSADEGPEVLEIAHLIPSVAETILAIYIGINDAVCNKGLVTPFLPRHAHNNVFVFDSQIFAGGEDVPEGTIDAKNIINGFLAPNESWLTDWTYVMIANPDRSNKSLWDEKGYIDMIPAKFEDFTMMSDLNESKVCTFIDPEAFNHPVNQSRKYLKEARKRGEEMAGDFVIPEALAGETKNLVPVLLNRGEKLYVARPDSQPCDHCWTNIHPDNKTLAVVNENSAVPLNLVISKPPVADIYKSKLIPPAGSADSTTDWFFRSSDIFRKPVKPGHIGG